MGWMCPIRQIRKKLTILFIKSAHFEAVKKTTFLRKTRLKTNSNQIAFSYGDKSANKWGNLGFKSECYVYFKK
jgi:hypothetical protein